MGTKLEIRLLGELTVLRDGRAVELPASKKTRALLGYLVATGKPQLRERFCELLHRMTGETDTRYLIVTHNAVTMSRMDRLYGVTMIEKGVSRLVSVDLGGAETLLAAE